MSGGGGWGQKQGLLSLDPQMSHPSSSTSSSRRADEDDEDDADAAMASFLRSLQGETEAQSGDNNNLATPGAHVQFFVAPLTLADADADADGCIVDLDLEGPAPAVALGAHPGYEGGGDGGPAVGLDGQQPAAVVALIPDHFGAVSNQGVFLAGIPSDTEADDFKPYTKLDAPHAFVWSTSTA